MIKYIIDSKYTCCIYKKRPNAIDTFSVIINIFNKATVLYSSKNTKRSYACIWISDGIFIPKAKTFIE